MLILGIETSCDDTGIALVEVENEAPRVLLNFISSQFTIHSKYGGVVPYLAAREHEKNLPVLIKKALKKHKNLNQIDLIAVTIGPGLSPSLLIGTTAAKILSYFWRKSIIGVNHLEGHLFSPYLNIFFERPILKFPFLCLLVSGGHSELVIVKGIGQYSVLGRTLDDACGEAFDKAARLLGLAYPGGPEVEKLAFNFESKLNILKTKPPNLLFKPPMIDSGDFNFSYSGLKTALLYKIVNKFSDKNLAPLSLFSANQGLEKKQQSKFMDKSYKACLAWHFQEAALQPLVKKTLLAAQNFQINTIIVAGGVSNNQRLKQMFQEKIKKEKISARVFFPDKLLTQDNAAMIAYAGYLKFIQKGQKSDSLKYIQPNPNLTL